MPIERTVSPPASKRQMLSNTGASPAAAMSSLAPSIPSRPITDLQPNQLRIFSWNINGIAPFLQKSITSYFTPNPRKRQKRSRSPQSPSASAEETSPSLRVCLKRWKFPHLVTLQEVKISPGDKGTIARVRAAVRAPAGSAEPDYEASFALPRDRFNARGFGGKLYGVVLLTRRDLLVDSKRDEPKRATEVDWDLEGRVLKFEIELEKVVVFGVYAVNGTENPYRSPKTGLITGTRHDRKRVFHSELASEAESYEKRGWSVVIAGDLNIAQKPIDGFPGIRLGAAHVENRKDFEEKFLTAREADNLSLIDSFRELHGNERKYSYRSRGISWGSSCDRVDLILISSLARKSLLEADILDEERERGPSDHVPLYVTLDLARLRAAPVSEDVPRIDTDF